jgi:hypothetical protein
MPGSKSKDDERRKALVGLFGGVLAIPALALASTAVFGPTGTEAEAAGATTETGVATVTAAPAATTTTVTATAGDLRRACGRDGRALVEAEAAGTIDAVEQAALDALRPICADEGTPLAEPPAPEPVVVTASQRSDVTTVSFDDDGDDDDTPDDDDFDDDTPDDFDSPDDFDTPDDDASPDD